jgi:hypothetical protein
MNSINVWQYTCCSSRRLDQFFTQVTNADPGYRTHFACLGFRALLRSQTSSEEVDFKGQSSEARNNAMLATILLS